MTNRVTTTGIKGNTYETLFRRQIKRVKPPAVGMAVAYVSVYGFNIVKKAGWPRAVTHPRLPRIRACPIRAPGSSDNGLAAQRYTLCTTRTGGRG